MITAAATLSEDILFNETNTKYQTPAPARIVKRRLDNRFYSGLRKRVTQGKLRQLTGIADEIPLPSLLGTFMDEAHYLHTLDFLLASTEETQHSKWFFLRELLPRLANKDRLLDVGIGKGYLTRLLSRGFHHVTVVDPNYEALHAFNSRKTEVKKINDSIVNANFQSNSYTLGMLSHVLYDLSRDLWFEVVDKVFDALKPGGVLAIVLNGDGDKSAFTEYFGGSSLDLEPLLIDCANHWNASFELFASDEVVSCASLRGLLHVANLYLCDTQVCIPQEQVIKYLVGQHKVNDELFEMRFQQKFVLISKF